MGGKKKKQQQKEEKEKKKRNKKRPQKKLHTKNGERVYICDRCGRNDFINGHALGGHKKYCMKPEYDEARGKKSGKKKRSSSSSRKRARSTTTTTTKGMNTYEEDYDGGSNNNYYSYNSKYLDGKLFKDIFSTQPYLTGIANSIRRFADDVDGKPNSSSKENGGELNELDSALSSKDLFELEVIQQVLREEKARLAGRIAGLEVETPLFDFIQDTNGEEDSNVPSPNITPMCEMMEGEKNGPSKNYVEEGEEEDEEENLILHNEVKDQEEGTLFLERTTSLEGCGEGCCSPSDFISIGSGVSSSNSSSNGLIAAGGGDIQISSQNLIDALIDENDKMMDMDIASDMAFNLGF